MNRLAFWAALLLALCAMQAHALLHIDHEATGQDSACLSCKVGQQLDLGLTSASATASGPLSASASLSPAAHQDAWIGAIALRPPVRGPPRS